jgi:cellobiose-specific phosphotransferase system component IIB
LVSNTLSKHNINQLKDQNSAKDQEIAELKQKLFETQKALDEAVLNRKAEGTAIL